jgi:hypothetical protein
VARDAWQQAAARARAVVPRLAVAAQAEPLEGAVLRQGAVA